ncbi:ATP-dependent DNA helicase [Isoptericola variabilis]|uniref:DNA 3'-5' helicase n=1 Tax=Isoptericola variabilis (strain 225) TaxID=743718 RepID=F6FXB0_ISOV2|nr:ATP-dependent DNA helicase [Isoptericola variabilis]AEG43613.1 UvrD/REP helicase [Isoptericola variabilis 225]TWH32019.1 DNA helicase-2/ATP-dependent DNA helicase PcrA [Isoptericola variabilis J7]
MTSEPAPRPDDADGLFADDVWAAFEAPRDAALGFPELAAEAASPEAGRAPELSARDIAALLGRHAPTDEQVAVIEAPLEPVLVVAGAGSGKTETMAARVVWLIANRLVEPEEVLGLTFTRKAAGELAARVQSRLAQLARAQGRAASALDLLARPTVATYNAYAASLVADHGLRLGIEPGSRLLGEANQYQLAAQVVESWADDLGTDKAVSTVVGAVLALSGALGEHLVPVDEARDRLRELVAHLDALPLGPRQKARTKDVQAIIDSVAERERLLDLVEEYRRRKRATDSLDFGDQIAFAADLARTVPAVGAHERARYRVVLLDEYQDTSYAQVELLAGLFGGGHAVTAVGDPHQSIYGWRGASASGLARFPERFRTAAGAPAAVRYLSTSWRNDAAVLAAANVASAPLREPGPGGARVEVPPLDLRPGAGPGAVAAHVATTLEEEAEAVAEWVAARWRRAARPDGSDRVTAAVLCRARAQFPAVEVALRRRGLPVEVVGLGGLLSTPEVVDVVALLEAVHDPSRGDSLVRLLTGPRVNLGASDLHALGSWAADLARTDDPHKRTRASSPRAAAPPDGTPDETADGSADETVDETTADETVVEGDVVDHRSVVDALDDLPEPGVPARDGRVLSPEGHRRLTALARVLRGLRGLTYLSLPELVVQAERALGLDVEVATADVLADRLGGAAEGVSLRGREHLDAFRDVAASFAQSADVATLGAFLAWLGVASEQERGLDMPVREPDPDAVQVITAHASKGLEWDVVAVPGLVDGVFPSQAESAQGRTDSGWLTDVTALPYHLRGDAEDLPAFRWDLASDTKDLAARRDEFKLDAGAHQLAEERRLAYVAFTRARRELFLTAHRWGTGSRPRRLSPFLVELVEAGVVSAEGWAGEPDPEGPNPRDALEASGTWPAADDAAPGSARDVLRATAALVERAAVERAEDVRAAGRPDEEADPVTAPAGVLTDGAGNDLVELARTLLAERDERTGRAVELPAHVSASGLVRLATDRSEFALQLRRPVPNEPTVHARRGTRFHEWVEQYFSSASLVDVEDLPGAEDAELPADADLEALRERFLASEWAGRTPIAIEQDVETPVAGVLLRSRIDAVFTDPDAPPAAPGEPQPVVVVDWKTGREPSDPEARAAREVQLAVYRLAWSRWTGLPLEKVSAAFCYVASGVTVRPERLLDEHELEALILGTADDHRRSERSSR